MFKTEYEGLKEINKNGIDDKEELNEFTRCYNRERLLNDKKR